MKTKTTRKVAPKQNALISAIQTNDTVTHNGAVSHSTTGTAVLDFYGKGGALRSQSETDVISQFSAAYSEDKTLTLKVLFYLSDVRKGQGERKLFRTCYRWLADQDPNVAKKLLKYIPEYTRFDNVLETLVGTKVEKDALKLIAEHLLHDLNSPEDGSISLCAKWAPSEQASSKITKTLAYKLRKYMKLQPREYRKMLSELRARIDVVERKMCAGDWKKINYEAVPSKATSLYKDAFKKHDPTGYTKFISQVEKGEKKINASVLYPYDLVREYVNSSSSYYPTTSTVNPTTEAQWKALPNYLEGDTRNILVIADTSGSMDSSGYYGGKTTNVRPIDVAVSLAIYTAERSQGAFKNYFMVFSGHAELLKLKGTTLAAKVKDTLAGRPCGNTNLQSAFNLILDRALKHKVPQEEMPSTLLIISDMQFDQACEDSRKTNLEVIKKKYEAAGYTLPGIVFWNVNSYQDVPVKVNDKGVCMVSGCSPVVFKNALNRKITSPWDVMIQTVMVERYEPITA